MSTIAPRTPCAECFARGPQGSENLTGAGRLHWLYCKHTRAGSYFFDDERPIIWRTLSPVDLDRFRDVVQLAALKRDEQKALQVVAPGPETTTH